MTHSLTVTAVHVARLPGIAEPFRVPAFTPGLNLVYGPNASGKSSLLRAIAIALWPEEQRDSAIELTLRYRIGEAEYDVTLEAGRVTVTRDGLVERAPRLPSPATRHRYDLALHELLGAVRTDDFARAIARASVGGLDLDAAALAIGASDRLARPVARRGALDRARQQLRDTQARQAAAHDELARERALVEEVHAAQEAGAEAAACELALARLAAHERRQALAAELAALPVAVTLLRGHEVEAARGCVARWRAARLARRDADTWRDEAMRADAAEGPAPTNIDRAMWARWRRALDEHRTAHAEALAEHARAVARRDALARSLGDSGATVAADTLRALDHQQLTELAVIARRLEQAQAAHRIARVERDERQRTLALAVADGSDRPAVVLGVPGTLERSAASAAQRDAFRDAQRGLTRWLASDAVRSATQQTLERDGNARPSDRGIAALALVAISVVACGTLVSIGVRWAWGLLAATLLLGWWAWSDRRARVRARRAETQRLLAAQDDACEATAREVRTLIAEQMPLPATWTSDAVSRLLDDIALRIVALERHRDAVDAAQRAEAQLEQTARALQEAESARDAIGVAAGAHFDADARTFGWWIGRLEQWQDAHADVDGAHAQLVATATMAEETLRAVDSALAPWSSPDDRASPLPVRLVAARARLQALEERLDARARAREACAQAERERDRASEALRAEVVWWHETLVVPGVLELALPASDAASDDRADALAGAALQRLEALDAMRPRATALQDAERDVRRECDRLDEAVAASPLAAAWRERARADLEAARAAALERAGRRDALTQELGSVRRSLEIARASHDVERALATVSEAREDLRAEWRTGVSARLAHLLVRQVEAATRDRQRPAVFHRARHWLARITHGRWKLHLDDGDPPTFSAEDTRTMRRHALDTLSAGTRVQLLVAIRMAFVEHEEGDTGPHLPLFLDETLGTSDEQRASAVIEAVLELVRAGRQVFYSTAQGDEVGQWRAAAEAGGLSDAVQLVDLGAVRDGTVSRSPTARATAPFAPPPRAPVPDPTGHSHRSFGALLQPAPIVAAQTPLGATPLWYVVSDLDVLHALLALGITTWGEWQWYTECGGGVQAVTGDRVASAWREAEAMAELLAHWHDLAGAGRGRPVDRTVLRACGAVSERFLEEIATVAADCAGDAAELLTRLDAGAVAGVGTTRVAALRQALAASGHLATGVSYSAADIRLALLSRADDDVGRVEALLTRLAARGMDTWPSSPEP